MPLNGPRSLSNFTIGTFNVRGLSSAIKRDQLSEYLNRLHIDVCCIQETKCPSGFDVISGYYRLIGLPSTSRHYGLAFAVASYLAGGLLQLLVSVRQTWSHSADSRQSLYIDDHQRLWPHLSGNTPQPGYARMTSTWE